MEKRLKALLAKLAQMEDKRGTVKDFVSREFINDNGDAVIDVNLEDDDNLFSPYSDKKVLNPEILDYIDQLADPIPAHIPLVINFIVDDERKVDQNYIRSAFRRHYWLSYKDKVREAKRNLVTALILSGIGIFMVFLYYNLKQFAPLLFVNEIVLISSWVFVWEGVNRFFLGRREKRIDMINEGQMAVATVNFESRKKNLDGTNVSDVDGIHEEESD